MKMKILFFNKPWDENPVSGLVGLQINNEFSGIFWQNSFSTQLINLIVSGCAAHYSRLHVHVHAPEDISKFGKTCAKKMQAEGGSTIFYFTAVTVQYCTCSTAVR